MMSTPEPDPQTKPSAPPIQSAESLQKLRSTVREAIKHLRQLKQENLALHARIRELQEASNMKTGTSVLQFDDDPKALRKTVEGFIQAIDTYLAEEHS